MTNFPADLIGFLIELAEAGHKGARGMLHEESAEGNPDPRLAEYRLPPRDRHGNLVAGRPRGRPLVGSKDGEPDSRNAGDPLRRESHQDRAAVAIELARRAGYRGDEQLIQAARMLNCSDASLRKLKTKAWREIACRILDALKR